MKVPKDEEFKTWLFPDSYENGDLIQVTVIEEELRKTQSNKDWAVLIVSKGNSDGEPTTHYISGWAIKVPKGKDETEICKGDILHLRKKDSDRIFYLENVIRNQTTL